MLQVRYFKFLPYACTRQFCCCFIFYSARLYLSLFPSFFSIFVLSGCACVVIVVALFFPRLVFTVHDFNTLEPIIDQIIQDEKTFKTTNNTSNKHQVCVYENIKSMFTCVTRSNNFWLLAKIKKHDDSMLKCVCTDISHEFCEEICVKFHETISTVKFRVQSIENLFLSIR